MRSTVPVNLFIFLRIELDGSDPRTSRLIKSIEFYIVHTATVKTIQSRRTSAGEMFYNVYMAVLEIRKYPEKILKQKTAPVQNIDGDIQSLIADMIETMHAAHGVGLAANQVGIPQKLCVIDLSLREDKSPLIVLINPFIVEREGIVEADEGCLSVPGYLTLIKRAERVCVKGVSREGKDVALEAEGLLARAIQHELDHLDGLLFIDRMSPIKREFFKRRYKKQLREAKGT
jgi:peptide deformylase